MLSDKIHKPWQLHYPDILRGPECLELVTNLLSELHGVMREIPEELKAFEEKGRESIFSLQCSTYHLSLFKQVIPTFLSDENERATTRYLNITTIATFFSSVTATTLQFTYNQGNSTLGGLTNLFWFLSLVFSVSSGVSSLLGMTWRRSPMYVIVEFVLYLMLLIQS